LLLLLSSIFTFNACKKDELALQDKKTETKAAQTLKGFRQYAWSPKEQSFFSIVPRASQSKNFRSDEKLIYHPLVKKAYNEIARQNEQEHFVEGIMTKVGVPIWDKSFVHYNFSTRDNLVVIPLAFEKEKQLSGFIAVTEDNKGKNKRYIINTMSRQELLDTKTGNYKQKAFYTKKMLQYEKGILGTIDEALKNANCHYKNNEENNLNPPPCEWKVIELCYDDLTQEEWIGGHPPKYHPIVGDHDGDGIPNKDDDDYKVLIEHEGDDDKDGTPNKVDKEWLNLHLPFGDHDDDGVMNKDDAEWIIWYEQYGDHDNDGILNKDDQDWREFEIRYPHWDYAISDWVEDNFGDFDNFDDWWEEYEDDLEDDFSNGIDIKNEITDFLDNFGDIWGAILDHYDNLDPKYDGDDIYYDPDPHPHYDTWNECPDNFGGGKIASSNGSHPTSTKTGAMRDVRCEWFYAIDCPNIPNKWWHGFDLVVPCPECGGGSFDPETEKWSRLDEFIRRYHLDPSLIDFLHDNIATDCSPSSPPIYYEDCVKAAFIDHLKVKFGLDKQQTSALTSLLNSYTSTMFQSFLDLANNSTSVADKDYIKLFLTSLYNNPDMIRGMNETIDNQNIIPPFIDVTHPICPKSFKFINDNDNITKSGLKNILLSFNSNGVTKILDYGYLYFSVPDEIAIQFGSSALLFSTAFNNAVEKFQNQINNGNPSINLTKEELKSKFYLVLHKSFDLLMIDNAGHHSSKSADCKWITSARAGDMNWKNGQPHQIVEWNKPIVGPNCP
jgi:hypothetical protein